MKALLPIGFDLMRHLNQYPPATYGVRGFNPDYAYYILSQITLVPARNKEIADQMLDGFTPLYSKLLQKVVRRYNDYLAYFVKTGIVYTSGTFTPSSTQSRGHSRGYRFRDTYENAEVVAVEYSPSFARQLRRKRKADFMALQNEYGHLTRWLWPVCHLQINAPLALEFLRVRLAAQRTNPTLIETKTDPKFGFAIPKDPQLQYKYAKANVDCLVSGDIGCTVDGKVGRMHTVLTNIKSDLRHLITYKGKSLVSLDIQNSQPYLSTVLFSATFWEEQGPSKDRRPLLSIHKVNKAIASEITNPSLILAHLKELSDYQDLVLYIELVSAKKSRYGQDLYTYMKEQSATVLGYAFSDRDQVKKGMFEVLFSKNSYYGKTRVKKLFKELFPSVNTLFSFLKEGDHTRLPRLLQSLESYIVLQVITKAIHRRNKAIPLFTIHDSITTTAEHVQTVRAIMEKELMRLVGLPPKLKIEPWQADGLNWSKYQSSPVR